MCCDSIFAVNLQTVFCLKSHAVRLTGEAFKHREDTQRFIFFNLPTWPTSHTISMHWAWQQIGKQREWGRRVRRFFFCGKKKKVAPKSTYARISLKQNNQKKKQLKTKSTTTGHKQDWLHTGNKRKNTAREQASSQRVQNREDRCKERKTSDGYIQVTSKEHFSWNIFQAVLFVVMAAKYWLRTTWAVGAVFYKPFRAQSIGIYRKINGLMMAGNGGDSSAGCRRRHALLGRRAFCFWNDADMVWRGSKFSFREYSQTGKQIKRKGAG